MHASLGKGVFVNFGAVFLDTCLISIGARTLMGPNCCFYSGTHPLDPFLRNGIKGPELGKPITVGEDCVSIYLFHIHVPSFELFSVNLLG